MPSAKTRAAAIALEDQPGYHIRRLQQIAVAVFLQETEAHGITPVQYAALQAVANAPEVDQRTLAGMIGVDTSTGAGVIDRLEARGLLERKTSPHDRRVRLLAVTNAGRTLLQAVAPGMLKAQARILAPLDRAERAEFMRLLRLLVEGNNDLSRAPASGP